jgi:SAM-dependent methyltransferase
MEGESVRAGARRAKNTVTTIEKKQIKCCAFVVLLVAAFLVLAGSAGDLQVGRMYPPRARSATAPATIQNSARSFYRTFKSTLKHYIRSVGDTRLLAPVLGKPPVKRILSALPVSRHLYCESPWDRIHPYDRCNGTNTSGFMYGGEILTGHPAEEHGSPYAGAQPSVIRAALRTIPGSEDCAFVDLGCGKGRPMLVASEFPFRDIVGVELSPLLAEIARRNAVRISKRYPNRTPIKVDVGDATTYPIPSGDVVLFIYNSFDGELMQKVVGAVEEAIAAEERAIYVIYCNPVSGACFDNSPLLVRRWARTIPYAPDELGYAVDTEDAVIVWQGGNAPASTEPADGDIVIVTERWRAALV